MPNKRRPPAMQLLKLIYNLAKKYKEGLASTSNNKFVQIESWFARQVAVDARDVLFQFAGATKNVPGRIRQAKEKGRLSILTFISPVPEYVLDVARAGEFPADILLNIQSPKAPTSIAQIVAHSIVGISSKLLDKISSMFPGVPVHEISSRTSDPMAAPISSMTSHPMAAPILRIDERTRRMARIALSSSPAVLLVGPPGTGKSTLIRELIAETQADPSVIGFATAPSLPKWVTAEEGWTARDLVGGETVDEDHRLRFALGHVLDAIRENRWLVIDETNRADMDKIFGVLMTWLGRRRPNEYIDLGRASTSPTSPTVQLGWSATPDCATEGLDRLAADDVEGDPIRFSAGTTWRLLGTYNAVDAHRVFRFGQALGRRFVRVPVLPPPPSAFAEVLEDSALPDAAATKIHKLYEAHYSSAVTQLGPAVFENTVDYVRAALAQNVALDHAIAEAYLTSVGSWLARLEADDLHDLGQRLISNNSLSDEEWKWITSLLPALG